MKLVVQRVKKASVSVSGKVVGAIAEGLLVLVGVGEGDTKEIATLLATKLSKLRVLADPDMKMNLSTLAKKTGVLAVSQFTLYGDTTKGNRPSFIKAAAPDKAQELYHFFVEELRNLGIHAKTGSFGEYMDIEASLDGPVTLVLES